MPIFQMSQRHRTPSIRMINLVDILLNLLIFFIASTTFRMAKGEAAAVKVALPEARTGEAVGKTAQPRLQIMVTPDQRIFLDQHQIGLVALEQAMRAAKSNDANVQIELSADKNVSYGTVVAIVDAARAAGVHNITAFTKKSVAGTPDQK
jgi:biopolymer transport protein ExbD